MSIQKVNKQTGDTSLICGSTLWADAPLATIFPLMSNNIPTGFLLCDDTAYRASDYPELWAILPSTVKDTVNNTFTIDLRESSLKGVGLTSLSNNHYDSDGLALGEFIDDQIQNFTLNYRIETGANAGAVMATKGSGDLYPNLINSASVGRFGDTTEVKAVGVNYIIKAKQVALPSDLEAQVGDAVEETIGWTLIKKVTSSSSYSTTFAIPNNYNELLAVCGTPYYQFSDVIPQSIMDSSGQFSGYHQTGFTGSSMSQQYCYTLSANGNFTSPTVIQNGADNAGFFALYYR